MALIRDLREVAGEFEAHALARADRPSVLLLQPVKEITDRHAQNLTDLIEAAGGNPVDAALIFVRLLVGDADQVGKLLLGQAQHDAALAHPRPDMTVDVLGAARGAARGGGAKRRGGGPAGRHALLHQGGAGLRAPFPLTLLARSSA